MRVVFMGTPDFAVGTLEALVKAGHEVVLAVTQPDKPKGRGKAMQPTPVKEAAEAHGIPVYQPVKIREASCVDYLRTFQPDVIVVDPPRAGINYKALPKILKYGVDQILYISCNPKTLVENLRFMEEHGYVIGDIKAYDNFPFTAHVECAVVVRKVK